MTRNEQIIADVKGGMTFTQAAEKHGVTKGVVAGICHRAGVRLGYREDIQKKQGLRNIEDLKKLWAGRDRWRKSQAFAA